MNQILPILNISFDILLALSAPVILFLSSRNIFQWVVSIFVLLLMLFYYSGSAISFLTSYHLFDSNIVPFINSFREWGLIHWPNFGKVTLFGFNLFNANVNKEFHPTWWPIIILYVGAVIRLVVAWFIRHDRLRNVGNEYWLSIPSFLILSLIVSDIYNWNFLGLFLIFVVIVFFIAIGILTVIRDFLSMLWNVIQHIGKWLWIFLKYLAFGAVKITKFLRNIVRNVRDLYDRIIRQPFRQIQERLEYIEQKQDGIIEDKLTNERLDN